MATYDDILVAMEDGVLGNRVRVACLVAAENICAEIDTTPNHANRMIWAARVFANSITEAQRVLPAVIVKSRASSLTQIKTAADATIQTAVDAIVNRFATGT